MGGRITLGNRYLVIEWLLLLFFLDDANQVDPCNKSSLQEEENPIV